MSKKKEIIDKIADDNDKRLTFNPLLTALRENDKKNMFTSNVNTAFIKTGFPLIDYYFGSVINVHDELGNLVCQEPRIGQAAGTFNLIVGNSGSGKCEPVSTNIPTPNGWVRMGDIKKDDYVFTITGKKTKVLNVFPQGIQDVYKVTFADGRYALCGLDHLWTVREICKEENYISDIKTINTKEMLYEMNISGHSFEIPMLSKPVEFEDVVEGDEHVDLCTLPLAFRINMICSLIVSGLLNKEVDDGVFTLRKKKVDDETFRSYVRVTQSLGYFVSVSDTELKFRSTENDDSIRFTEVTSIKFSHSEECQCIYVEDDSHLYLTDQFVVTHNTTLAAQIAANIMRQFPYANVIHYDCEQRFDISRCETVTQLPSSYFNPDNGMERYMIKTGMVGLDTIQEMIVKTYVNKVKLKDQMMVDSGYKNEFGKPLKIYQPTIIIMDSVTSVLSETFSADNTKDINDAQKLRANTEGARDAKTLKGFLKEVLPLCKEANITIYGINHINSNMSMNSFTPVAKQQNYMKQDEIIPGGKTMIFYPYNIMKLTAKPGDDFTEESDGFSGHIVMVEPVKSSSNQSGNNSKGISFEMVFSFKYGFDSLRTLILYGRTYGIIEGNKTRMKFRDDDSFTFNFKNIYKEKDEKPIWENIKKYIIPHLLKHLPFVEPNKFDNRSLDY